MEPVIPASIQKYHDELLADARNVNSPKAGIAQFSMAMLAFNVLNVCCYLPSRKVTQ